MLLDEARIDDSARLDSLVDQALRLVPGDLARDVGDIESRLRVDVIRSKFDCYDRVRSTIRVDITRDRCAASFDLKSETRFELRSFRSSAAA